jgi:hypothetical protein
VNRSITVLSRAGFPCAQHSLALHWLQFVHDRCSPDVRLGVDDYELVGASGQNWGLAEWVFALPPVRRPSRDRDERVFALARKRDATDDIIAKLSAARALAPAFVDEWATRLIADDSLLVGFSTTYSQNTASLCLAHRIKELSPATPIVFGGANCEGPMGAALQRAFPWIDVVVNGPGEKPLLSIVEAIAAARTVPRTTRICVGGRAGESDGDSDFRIDDIPQPDYDEYFSLLQDVAFAEDVESTIPFESSRGCWWGAKHHCTFCGLNGATIAFHSKEPVRMVEEIASLCRVVGSASLANLLLARSNARRHEFGVRAALGAAAVRIFVLVLTECLVLAAARGSCCDRTEEVWNCQSQRFRGPERILRLSAGARERHQRVSRRLLGNVRATFPRADDGRSEKG